MYGDTFHVHVNKYINVGWSVSVCQVRIDGISCPTIPTALSWPTTPVATATAEELTLEDDSQEDQNFQNPFEEFDGEEGNPDKMQNQPPDESKDNTKSTIRKKSPMKLKYLVPLVNMAFVRNQTF